MHHILPTDLQAALDDISTARLSSYKSFFNTQEDSELYGLYCWNDAISSRYMRLIGILEILLRNRIHSSMSFHAWGNRSTTGTQDSNDWYMNLYTPFGGQSTSDRSLKKKIGNKNNPASANKVIAGMTYGFWPYVLDKTCDNSGALIPWGSLIPKIVPGHHQRDSTYWGKQAHQDQLFARMMLVGDLRNRAAHFEPLWKFGDEMSETRDRPNAPRTVVGNTPSTIDESLARLQKTYRQTTQLLHWLSKARAADYSESENHQALVWLVTRAGLEHFRSLPTHHEIRLRSLTKSWKNKDDLKNHKFARVTYRRTLIGRYYSAPC